MRKLQDDMELVLDNQETIMRALVVLLRKGNADPDSEQKLLDQINETKAAKKEHRG